MVEPEELTVSCLDPFFDLEQQNATGVGVSVIGGIVTYILVFLQETTFHFFGATP